MNLRNLSLVGMMFALGSCLSAPRARAVLLPQDLVGSADSKSSSTQSIGVMNSIAVGDDGLGTPVSNLHSYTSFLSSLDRPNPIESWLVEWTDEQDRIVFSMSGPLLLSRDLSFGMEGTVLDCSPAPGPIGPG